MAEQEVIKHVKKVFGIWQQPGAGFWLKIREFVLEIVIIVFAVTVSIALHDASEKKHLAHETKEFLLGLRLDLKNDIMEMQEDKKSYFSNKAAFTYFSNMPINTPPHPDSLKLYQTWLFSTTSLVPNNGRFEGFKSAGKITNISPLELQNNILDLYQEDISSLLNRTSTYNNRKDVLIQYILQHQRRITDSTNNLRTILASEEVHNISSSLKKVGGILEKYDQCIEHMQAIVRDIELLYHP
ncbi:MAG: hypothetical protein IPG86_01760 [Chitinophagaceae bacterium]|nr:hypothetical protein [Chitinophagaceae bacterium]